MVFFFIYFARTPLCNSFVQTKIMQAWLLEREKMTFRQNVNTASKEKGKCGGVRAKVFGGKNETGILKDEASIESLLTICPDA